MSGWAWAFLLLLGWHLGGEFVSARLIYWQQRHIAVLKQQIGILKIANHLLRSKETSE